MPMAAAPATGGTPAASSPGFVSSAASLADGATGLPEAQEPSAAADEFLCHRCGEMCPLSSLSGGLGTDGEVPTVASKLVEAICNTSYKSLAKRWKKNAKLKTWWSSLSGDERQAWYVKHKRAAESVKGYKREYTMTVTHSTEQFSGNEKRRRIHWKPYSVIKDEMEMKGKSQVEILTEWRNLLMSGERPVQRIGDMWHVGYYMGVIDDEVDGNMMRSSSSSLTECQNASDVQDALAETTRALQALQGDREAKRRKVGTAEAEEAAVPESFIKCAVEGSPTDEMLGLESLMAPFEQKAQYQTAMQALEQEEDMLAAASEATSSTLTQTVSKAVQKLQMQKHASRMFGKLKLQSEEWLLEAEQLVTYLRAQVTDADAGPEAEEMEQHKKELEQIIKDAPDAAAKLEKNMMKVAADAPFKDNDMEPVKECKSKLLAIVKESQAPDSAMRKLRDSITAVRKLFAKKNQTSAKNLKAEKLKLKLADAAAGDDDASTAGADAKQYLYSVTWASVLDKKDLAVKQDAESFKEGCACKVGPFTEVVQKLE